MYMDVFIKLSCIVEPDWRAPRKLLIRRFMNWNSILSEVIQSKVLGPTEFYQYRCICRKAIWRGELWEAPNLHHCPERSHYVYTQPIPSPHIQNNAHHLSSCTSFSKMDLMRAYHQIPAHTDDIKTTAITTPFGLFEFPCLSFSLRNCLNLSTFYGRNPKRLGFLLRLFGRHPCL